MGAASGGLGGDVADSKARCAAGEQPVGDQRTLGAKTGTLEERRGIQHLLHARATGGALVSNHQHLARLDDAQRARGSAASPRAFAVPLVVRSLRHAEQLGDALAARGLDD